MYEFNWEGKELAYKLAQTPSTGTLRPDKESSKNWDDTENLYIEGDNLEVLKLLQKSYFGKVKMIYIDPPYNTGKDFVYHDNFRDNIANYKEITNQTTRANSETNGRYHTDWLNMMYSRLKVSRNLLTDDGVIFISIDDNEVFNIRKVCDEIFGEENFIATFIRQTASGPKTSRPNIDRHHEYLICYAKYIKNIWFNGDPRKFENYSNPDNDINGDWTKDSILIKIDKGRTAVNAKYPIHNPYLNITHYPPIEKNKQWHYTKPKFDELLKKGQVVFYKNKNEYKGEYSFYIKKYKSDLKTTMENVSTIFPIKNNYTNALGTNELKCLFENKVFDSPKPSSFIKKLIQYSTNEDSLVLDFFSGASTTADAIIKMNLEDKGSRKFILVQIPELVDNDSDAYKSGYKNICEIGKERIRRAGDKIVSENKDKEGIENLDIGFKVFKLEYSEGDNKMYNEKLIELSNKTNIMYREHQIYEFKAIYFYILQTDKEYIQWRYKNDIFWNMEHSEEFYNRLMNPMKIEILTNKKPKELKGKKKIATINKDADYKVQIFVDDDYNLYYQDNHAFASCESKIIDNKVKTEWNSCKCWFKIIGLYECRNNHIVDILRDLNSYSEYLYPKNNVADNVMLSRLYEQMVNVYLDYVNN